MADPIPADFHSLLPWLPVVRHMRAVARQSTGYAVITVRVVINELGQPAGLWAMPQITKLVPRQTADQALLQIIEALTESDP